MTACISALWVLPYKCKLPSWPETQHFCLKSFAPSVPLPKPLIRNNLLHLKYQLLRLKKWLKKSRGLILELRVYPTETWKAFINPCVARVLRWNHQSRLSLLNKWRVCLCSSVSARVSCFPLKKPRSTFEYRLEKLNPSVFFSIFTG